MDKLIPMEYKFILYILVVPSILAAFKQSSHHISAEDLLIQKRAQKILELIKNRPCLELTAETNCTLIKAQSSKSMNFYMAEQLKGQSGGLSMKVPLKYRNTYEHLDAVVVVDPLPDAHFGHTLVVALIEIEGKKEACETKKGLYYQIQASGKSECMYLPKNKKCLVRLQWPRPGKKRQRPCSFNYIPFVYDTTDVQRLKCISKVTGFRACPVAKTAKNRCKNTANCKREPVRGNAPCHWSCDQAVMISGGWNKYTNRVRHLQNMKSFYNHLYLHRSFHKDNIKVFFANNATIELDGDSIAQDTVPAVDATSIVEHVKQVCSKDSKCIDTFVMYLNGPTTSNGDLLLWDWNQDGSASSTEILPIKDLLEPLMNCKAKNYLLIVDQNFAGNVIEQVKQGRKNSYANFEKIHVLTASNKYSYSWKRDFTKQFIQYDNNHIEAKDAPTFARRISLIAKDLQNSPNLKQYKIHYLEGSNKDLTITGDFGQEPGCTAQTIGSKG